MKILLTCPVTAERAVFLVAQVLPLQPLPHVPMVDAARTLVVQHVIQQVHMEVAVLNTGREQLFLIALFNCDEYN